jgi:tetratricopeptide (TPR) repeat protein
LEQANRADSVMRNDSLAKDLVAYFDKHGTPNERMRAHYILGRTYSDIGEAPRAISSYQDAIDAADTTVSDCDFYTLGSVYSQMATLYRSQLLLTNEIEARNKATHYDYRANEIKWAIYNQVLSSGAYILLNKKDSAEIILKSALEQYRKHGFKQQALRYSKTLLLLYTESPQRLDEAKALMDQFEAESDLFDEHHELPPSQRQYYYYKGKYFENIHKLDSAEYYYRKIYRPGMSYASQDPMYRGLLSVFSKRHQADSIAKYAMLYCMTNDSSIALKDQDIVAQMAANYNYSRFQNEAHENEVKAYKRLIGLIVTAVVLAIILIAAFMLWKNNQRKINRLKTEFANATDEYEENLHELQLLESTHQQVIATIQQELTKAQGESSGFREKYAKAQQTISQINQDYESEKSRLLEENEMFQKRIGELQKDGIISKYQSVSESFDKEIIVKRIREIANTPLTPVTYIEWNELTKAFENNYPSLFHDLSLHCNIPQYIRVCILTVLGIGSNDQANMLGTTKSRISNIKYALNKALFMEASSRTLYKNLSARYNIYPKRR